ncbi:MAG TPA: hypothetical protein VFH85_04055 [Gammaproteobacteria bacterium]|nr:hypothetical protein [Gammaproteobacteria bacterium]
MKKRLSSCGLLCIVLAFAATVSAAPAAASDAAGDKALHYPLTMAKMHAFYEAQLNIMKAAFASKDPKLVDSMSMDADASFDETVAKFEKQPAIKKAIEQAGLTTAEYVSITDAYMGAAFGAAYVKMKPDAPLPKVYDRHNIDFFKTHEKDLKAMQKEFMGKIQQLSAEAGGDEAGG